MTPEQILEQFIAGLKSTSLLEFIAVVAGIVSVWFSKKENILVYPVGLVNTVIYSYISIKFHLLGEASVNVYYTVMSLYGWYLWSRKDMGSKPVVVITNSSLRQWGFHLLFFAMCYAAIYAALVYAQKAFFPGAIPWADAFASATAFTGMWLMAKKKVESWIWWILTNIASIPLYFVKGLVFTSVYYFVLLVLAFAGLSAWRQKARAH